MNTPYEQKVQGGKWVYFPDAPTAPPQQKKKNPSKQKGKGKKKVNWFKGLMDVVRTLAFLVIVIWCAWMVYIFIQHPEYYQAKQQGLKKTQQKVTHVDGVPIGPYHPDYEN